MKVNDKKALQAKKPEELQKLIKEAYNTLSQLRIDNVQSKLKNTRSIFTTRKEIAVMKTLLQQKQEKEVTEEKSKEQKSKSKDTAK